MDDAFHYLSHIATWPDWWPQIVAVVTDDPDKPDVVVGDTATMRAKSFLPYGLDWETTVVRIERPKLIEVESRVRLGRSFGMRGTVAFDLAEADGKVVVLNRQEMVPDRPVPGWLVPLADRVFNFNHDFAMKRGQPGLQRVLKAAALDPGPSTDRLPGSMTL